MVTFRPIGAAQHIVVNDEQPAPELTMLVEAGATYRVRSLEVQGE